MMVSAGRRSGGLLQGCLRAAISDSSSLAVKRRSICTSAVRRSADPSPLETTSSMQESQTSADRITRGRTASGSSSQRRGGEGPLPEYPAWRNGKGKAYEETPRGQGPFWLGQTPFPLNPSFQPPPPVSHAVRETMWKLHRADATKNSVRALSGRFGIPMERTLAVLRLMALEDEYRKEGKALQVPFQQEMDRLLGAQSKTDTLRRERSSLNTNTGASGLRGPIFEAVAANTATEDQPSPIAAALQVESAERQERIKLMRTGGPALEGIALDNTETGRASRPNRPPIAFVDVSDRPESYAGVGKLRRNVKRAEQKKANMLKNRSQDPAWQRRHEISLMLKAGDTSPELVAEKQKLDEEKVKADAVRLAERLKRFKSNRKFKAAMKIARGQAALKKVQAHVERDQSPTVVL